MQVGIDPQHPGHTPDGVLDHGGIKRDEDIAVKGRDVLCDAHVDPGRSRRFFSGPMLERMRSATTSSGVQIRLHPGEAIGQSLGVDQTRS